jgi:hypothetical protein
VRCIFPRQGTQHRVQRNFRTRLNYHGQKTEGRAVRLLQLR